MSVSSSVSRSVLLSIFILALIPTALLGAAVPAVQHTNQASAVAAGCAQTAGPFADLVDLGFPGAPGKGGPACKMDASAAKSCVPGVNCHHYCACECSTIKDCNVNSDCSNHRCLSGISCC